MNGFLDVDINPNDVLETEHSVHIKPTLSQGGEKAFLFYLSSILHLYGDSLVRQLHQEPHQLHDD